MAQRIGSRSLRSLDPVRCLPPTLPSKCFVWCYGSEFINRVVADLLKKLLLEQTKSRARRSGDNGLVETKNAAILRKHIGFGHIAPGQAGRVNQFHRDFLTPTSTSTGLRRSRRWRSTPRPQAQALQAVADAARKAALTRPA